MLKEAKLSFSRGAQMFNPRKAERSMPSTSFVLLSETIPYSNADGITSIPRRPKSLDGNGKKGPWQGWGCAFASELVELSWTFVPFQM